MYSAVINCYNEELYIKMSIDSISEFVNEIIVVDNCSTDNSVKIIEEAMKHNNKIKLYKFDTTEPLNIARSFALEKATNDWIIKWDGDFVAFNSIDDGENYFGNLINIINANKDKFDVFLLYALNLSGDLLHYDTQRKFLGLHGDTFICKKKLLSYVVGCGYADLCSLVGEDLTKSSLRIYYLNNPQHNAMYFVHIYGVKPIEYLLYRCFMTEYHLYCIQNNVDANDFWKWFKEQKNKEKDNGIIWLGKYMVQFWEKHNSKLPKILENLINNPRYFLIYENGKITRRNDF